MQGSRGTSRGKVVIVIMIAQTMLAFMTRVYYGGHTSGVVAHRARHRGEVWQVVWLRHVNIMLTMIHDRYIAQM